MISKLLNALGFRKFVNKDDLPRVESLLSYRFRDRKLLDRALTHRSALQPHNGTVNRANELLEFLGDAVLDLIVAEYLYREYPDKSEGDLSKIKSSLVNGLSLQNISARLGLGEYIRMSDNEARNGGRNRGSILEDVLEAIIAAMYLDGGRLAAEKLIRKHILSQVSEIVRSGKDNNYKSLLLEFAQKRGMSAPEYNVTAESGPDHNKQFEVEVVINGEHLGNGSGRSKKFAQQQAARIAFERLCQNETPGS